MQSIDQGSRLPLNVSPPYIHKIYHMPREKSKVFWVLPNSYLNFMIEECKRNEETSIVQKIKSERFRTQTELDWKFVVFYQKETRKLGFLLRVQKGEEEKANQGCFFEIEGI